MFTQIFLGLGILFLIVLILTLAALAYMLYSDLFGKTKSKYRMLTPVDFPGRTVIIAEDQPEYIPLPAFIDRGENGAVVTCWRFTYLDRLKVLFTGRIWASVWTFNGPLQPLQFTVNKSDVLQ